MALDALASTNEIYTRKGWCPRTGEGLQLMGHSRFRCQNLKDSQGPKIDAEF